MQFSTQTNSRSRLKNDTLGENALKDLYADYATLSDADFRLKCVEMVQAGGGKQLTKDRLIAAINESSRKSVHLKKTQDFILAGMGLGV